MLFIKLYVNIYIVVTGHQAAGHYEVTWDGSGYANGIYFYQLEAGEFVQTERMVLIH